MKKLFFLSAMMLSMMLGYAQNVVLDFTTNAWNFPVGSANKMVTAAPYSNGTYTVTAEGSTGQGYYFNADGYLMLGQNGASLTLPAMPFPVSKIEVVGRTGASASVGQNIYVGTDPVSTQTTGATGTNTYLIDAAHQTAGTVYVIKVNTAHNSQITAVKFYAAPQPPVPMCEGFEGTLFPPEGWTAVHVSGSNSWLRYTTSPITGSASVSVQNAVAGHENWLITPKLKPVAGQNLTFKIKYATGTSHQSIHVKVSTTDNQPASFTNTELSLVNQTNTTAASQNVDLSAYVNQEIYIAFQVTDTNGRRIYIDDVCGPNLIMPSCATPTALASAGITAYTANISWTAGYAESNWIVEYATASDFSNAVTVNRTVANAPLTGLNSATTYYVRVKADCGGTDGVSNWTSSISFTTLCAPRTVPYFENFENITTGVPTCWDRRTGLIATPMVALATPAATSSAWAYFVGNVNIFDGSKNVRINNYGTTRREWLITPQIDLGSAAHNYQLTFDAVLTAYSGSVGSPPATTGIDDRFIVLVSTDGGNNWNPSDATIWDNDTSAHEYNSLGTSQEITIPLSSYTGIIKIAFYAESTITNADNYLYIDNVKIAPFSSCFKPTDLACNSVTSSSAAVSWTTNVTGTDILEYATTSDFTGATAINPATSPQALTDLTPNATYYVRVKTDCGATDGVSDWTSTLLFKTQCVPMTTLPYENNFNSYSSEAVPDCWTKLISSDAFPAVTTSVRYNGSGGSIRFRGPASMLASPAFNAEVNTLMVSFYVSRESAASSGTFEVGVMSDLSDLSTYDSIQNIIVNTTGNNNWNYVEVSLNRATAGKHYVVFKQSGATSGYFYHIDDIEIKLLPPCNPPTNITVPAASVTPFTAAVNWTPAGSETEWVLEYKKWNETTWTVRTPNPTTTPTDTLTNLTPSSNYDVRVKAICSSSLGLESSYYTKNYAIETPASCFAVTNITAPVIDTDSVTLAWTAGGTEAAWNIYVSTTPILNFSDVTPTHNATTNPFTVTGLTPNTGYYMYVQADCGSINGLSSCTQIIVTTHPLPQTPATLPYTPSFASNDGWDLVNGVEANRWFMGSTTGDASVTNGLYISKDNGATNIYSNVFGMPTQVSNTYAFRTINFDQAGTALISFEWKFAGTGMNDYVRAFLAPADAILTPGNQITGTPAGWTSLTTANLNGSNDYTVLNAEVPITATGTQNLVFYWRNTANMFGSASNPAASIINLSVTMPCFTPADIAAVTTLDEANITWTAGGTETAWNIIVSDTAITDFTNVTPIAVSTTPAYQATGLTETTNYYVYVQANCGSDNVSNWASTVIATQPCNAADQCNYMLLAHDSEGNGWGATGFVQIKQNGVLVASLTAVNHNGNGTPATDSLSVALCNNKPTELIWVGGESLEEISFELLSPAGDTLFAVASSSLGSGNTLALTNPLFSFTSTCPVIVEPCEAPTGLAASNITKNSIHLAWQAESGDAWKVIWSNPTAGTDSTEVHTTTYTVSGLAANTEYNIRVITLCANDEESAAATITETTEIDGISNIALAKEVTLYPNPASDQLTVKMESLFNTIEIINTLGQVVYRASLTETQAVIDVTNYGAGMYYVKLQGDAGMVTKKFVKR